MYELFLEIVEIVEAWGYIGIFIMTFIESTFVPIPAEITLIPAGYLIQKQEMNFLIVWAVSTLGTIGGSLFNYYIAYHYGRAILIMYGKYMFMDQEKLNSIEDFFRNHGAISTFTGRLLPGVKHFISFPAGLAKMDIRTFLLYTAVGGALWCSILLTLGYLIGHNEDLISKYIKQVNLALVVIVSFIIAFYIWKTSIKRAQKIEQQQAKT